MNISDQYKRVAFIGGLMLFAGLSRLIPHWPNFTAVMAVALFGGAKLKNNALAVLVPLVVMLVTDLSYSSIQFGSTNVVIGFHSLMPLVYLCIAMTSLVGIYISKKANTPYIIGASILASTLFFFVTNAGVWFHNPQFTQDIKGLFMCYDSGLPFYRNQLFGDLFFNGVLFGIYSLVSKRIVALRTVKA